MASAPSSPSAQTTSTTATGRPPIAATSLRLTITPHQPANQGSASTKALMKPSAAKSRWPSPSGIAAQSSPTRIAPCASPRRAATIPISAFAASAGLAFNRSARASSAAASMSGRFPQRDVTNLRRVARGVEIEVGAHLQMRATVQLDLRHRLPVHLLEKRRVLRLHMREERSAAHRMRRRDGESDQGRANCADAPVLAGHREPRPAPQARLVLVNAHRADDLVGRDPEHRQGHERDRVIIDRVAIVLPEQSLLTAEDQPPERIGAFPLPARSGEFDAELACAEPFERLEDHDASLRS